MVIKLTLVGFALMPPFMPLLSHGYAMSKSISDNEPAGTTDAPYIRNAVTSFEPKEDNRDEVRNQSLSFRRT